MGSGRWDAGTWAGYSTTHVAGKTASEVFTSTNMKLEFDPAKIEKRESRDSADNPNSTPIIIASDVTGSMGQIAHTLMKDGLNKLCTEIYDRKPVTDPHIMVMAIGDTEFDRAPLQVTQFEADIRIAEQTRNLWIEGGGGGNNGESYSAAHVFAAMKTEADSFTKRGKKGFLFTIGDEPVLPSLSKDALKRFLGIDAQSSIATLDAIAMAQRNYEVFHVVINGGYAARNRDEVMGSWKAVLPERVLFLEDLDKLAEVVVSAIQVVAGVDKSTVASSWIGRTEVVVANAIKDIAVGGTSAGAERLVA